MLPDQNSGGLFTGIAQHEIFEYVVADPLEGISDVALFLKMVCTRKCFMKSKWPLRLFHPSFGPFQSKP